jgi:DNA-binding MarR family transcriptional regulator
VKAESLKRQERSETNGERSLGPLKRRPSRSQEFDIDEWIPHQFSFVANRISAMLAKMYTERFGLSVVGWRMVAVLGRYAPLSAKELGDRLGMDQVSVTRGLAQLLSLKLASRGVDPVDRRKAVIRLTKRGSEVYHDVVPLALAIESVLMEGLTDKEIILLKGIMGKLTKRADVVLGDERSWIEFLPR